MLNTIKFINRLSKLSCEKVGGSKTQLSADIHEKKILDLFLECGAKLFNPSEGKSRDNSAIFRQWFKHSTGVNSRDTLLAKYNIISRNHPTFNYITPEIPWVIHQPHGSQNFPDMIVFKVEKESIRTLYIECKSVKPAFNNNPPKKNSNCIYICGNVMYNGYFMRSHVCVEMYNNFLQEYKRLIEKYKSIPGYDMVPVFYKKNEFKTFPPPFFNGKEAFNDRLNKSLIKNILQ
jgi:hypothetical protein